VPSDPSRRFLIASGTERYDDGDQLISVPDDLSKIAGFFAGLGYREQLLEVRLDPSSTALRSALSGWLNDEERHPSDTAVIYYSGHGDSHAGSFYLLTADSKPNRYADTALRADFVLEALGEIPAVRRVLLILDTCYAGQGAFNAAEVAARMAPWQRFSLDDEGIWVVAASSPRQEAEERLFADAFLEAAELLQQTTGTLQPYVGLEALIWQINTILRRKGKQQRANWIPVTQARGLAPFIPNARFDPEALANVDLETRNWLSRRHAAELADHWEPRSRGVQVAAQAGWYFTGRDAALLALTAWIAEPAGDARLRVVTGDPGSGKSAVLGRLVTLADANLATRPPETPNQTNSVPLAGSIAVALLARGKSTEELVAEVTAGLGVAAHAQHEDSLAERQAFTVVIDALDEAADPLSVIDKVIAPLLSAASPDHGPRLLVATRRYQQLLDSLPVTRVTIDLDQEPYRDGLDAARYVAKLLLAEDDPESPTPYRGQPDLARQVAEQVATIADRSFLIAQIVARTLARTPRAYSPAEVMDSRAQWRDVGAAFDRDLARYGAKAQQIRELLTPLAWARGSGLPRELWPMLATALASETEYTEADVAWVLEQAGFYLVETLEHDRSAYRLYHEQFAEHLRAAAPSPKSAHERITAALLRHVPTLEGNRREWLAATPYIRDHLAAHAARAGLLDSIASDPGFLLAADPVRLLPELAAVTDAEARKSASAFEATQHLLPGQPAGQAAAQLDMAARTRGAAALAHGISQLHYPRPWVLGWGRWASPDRHVMLGGRADGIRAVVTATLDDAPVAITADDDGAIRIWDMRTGIAHGETLRRHNGGINALAVGNVGSSLVAVTGGRDGTVRVWDLRARRALGQPIRGHIGEIEAIAAAELDGTPIAVTGGSDGTVRVWDLVNGSALSSPMRAHKGRVCAVATGQVGGTPMAVTGGSDGTVRVWNLRTGSAHTYPLRGHLGTIFAVATTQIDDTPVVVSASRDSTVRIWDLHTGTPRGKPLAGHTAAVFAVATGQLGRTPVAITGGRDSTIRVWDLRTGTPRGGPLIGHTGRIFSVSLSHVDGVPVAVTAGSDSTVRAWKLRTGRSAQRALRKQPDHGFSVVATGTVNGTPVAVTCKRDGSIEAWDLRSGAACGKQARASSGRVSALTTTDLDGVAVAVIGSRNGTLSSWNIGEQTMRADPLCHDSDDIETLTTAKVDGVPVAVIGGGDGTVRLRSLRTGAPQGLPMRGHTGEVLAIANAHIDGVPVAVTCGQDGTVRVWNIRSRSQHGPPMRGHTGEVLAIACVNLDGTPVAVTGGRDGTVRLWDLRESTAHGHPMRGHKGRVNALAVGEADGILVVVSGDDKGAILMRELQHQQRCLAYLDALADVRSIADAGATGWITITADGNIFTWRTDPRGSRASQPSATRRTERRGPV
jgi:WD40 repeat protein